MEQYEKCAIFIDGGYFDKLLSNWNFNLDYEKFAIKISREILGVKLLRVYYYNCIPIVRRMYIVECPICGNKFEVHFEPMDKDRIKCDKCRKNKRKYVIIPPNVTKEDEERLEKRLDFYNKLKRLPYFEVKFGRLTFLDGKPKQKGVDILMSLDIVDKCFEGQIQHVALIAGDSDFIPTIRKAKDYGAIVHLFCSKNKVNRELLNEVDEIHFLRPRVLNGLERK